MLSPRSHTNGHDEAVQETSLSPVGKNSLERQQEQQQHGRGSIFPHSPIAPISPTPRSQPVSNTQYTSFQGQSSPGPNSTATAVDGGAGPGAGTGKGGQGYFPGSFSGSVSRPGSRSSSETGSAFVPASSTPTSITSATTATVAPSLERGSEGPSSLSASGSVKGHQHHLKAGFEPHDSLPVSASHSSPASGAALLTGHSITRTYAHEGTAADNDSRRYPHHSHPSSSSSALGYSEQGGQLEHGGSHIEESYSSAGEAGPIVSRQRHTSLPQVLSHQSSNYPHPHHPHLQLPLPEGPQQQIVAAGYPLNPHDRHPPSPSQYHYPHPSLHTPGASMASTSSTSSTLSSSASYFGLQNASRAQQQRQYEQPGTSGSSSNSGTQSPYSMYYRPEHYRARSPSSPSSSGYPYEGHPHHPHPHGPYSHPHHNHDRVPPPPPHRPIDEWYDGRSSYHHQGHPYYYDAADRYQPPYLPPRLYTPPHHLQHHHHHHQDRRHHTSLPIRHHSRFPRRMSQPSTAPGGGSDPESRYIPFLNADLDEQDIRDPYAKRLANSDNQLPLSPPPVPQPRNVGSSKTSAIVSFASSSSVTTTGASGSGSTSGSQPIGTTGGNNGANLPVRGGPSTAFGGLVTNASGAPTAAIPGLVFSSRGDNTGSRTQFHAPLEPEVVAKLDDIFFKFLQRICSDLKACDAKGDHM
ncbi:hypothetical protein BKA57DRAFT_500210 [Linnemannia elongata]|nr:hypothetical protein BKA57DRAFT_500210 [Linnemannia elongata]